jgi:hypothetical protein
MENIDQLVTLEFLLIVWRLILEARLGVFDIVRIEWPRDSPSAKLAVSPEIST